MRDRRRACVCRRLRERLGSLFATQLILRFCIAGHFSWTEISRALKLYGMNELYAKDPRDACIIVAVNNRIFDLARIDEILVGQGFEKLSISIDS